MRPHNRRSVRLERDDTAAPVPIDRARSLRLLRLARPHSGRFALATVCMVVSTLGFLAIPYVFRLVTDSVFVHHNAALLNRVVVLLLAIVVVTVIAGFFRGYLLNYAGGRIVADLRLSLYRHLLDQSLAFYDARRSGDLISRLSSDTTMVQTVLSNDLLTFFQNVITVVGVTVVILVLDWRLALVTMAVAPVIAVTGILVGRRTRKLARAAQEQLGSATVVLEESLVAMRVVKAFVRERFEMKRYADAVELSFRTGISAARLQSAFQSIMTAAIFAALAAVLWFGGHEVLAGRLTPGGLISFLFYLTVLIGPLQNLAGIYTSFQTASGAGQRVFEILDEPPGIVDAVDAYPLPPVLGHVEMHAVSFRYGNGAEVLRDVTVTALPGEIVAIVGPSGAGKTTLLSLLSRFYDATGGTICVDGHNIAGVTIDSLRSAMAIVPQEATLFGGTVRENIAYGREGASAEEIEAAARAANAHDFVMALPEHYDSVVGDRGVKLSGGQRQRVAIARAILRDPRILILDEATSSLDNESEALVQEALNRLMVGRTTFVIAHRLTTVENADRIVVLDRGLVVEEGSHSELMARDGLYRRLYLRSFEEDLQIPLSPSAVS